MLRRNLRLEPEIFDGSSRTIRFRRRFTANQTYDGPLFALYAQRVKATLASRNKHMSKEFLQRLAKKHSAISFFLADHFWLLLLSTARLLFGVFFYVLTACIFLLPLIFSIPGWIWLTIKIPSVPPPIRILLGVFLYNVSIFSVAIIFGPFWRRINKRQKEFFLAVDSWLDEQRTL